MYGQEFKLITLRKNWGENRVYFYDFSDNLKSIPARWTSAIPEDPFVIMAAGRSFFRVEDLLDLHYLINSLEDTLNRDEASIIFDNV